MADQKKKRRGRGNIEVVAVPDWVVNEIKDGPAMASALALAELEDKWLRLSAADQNKLVGYAVFGKKAIYIDSTSPSEVRIMHSAAFGTDASISRYNWNAVTRAARERRRL